MKFAWGRRRSRPTEHVPGPDFEPPAMALDLLEQQAPCLPCEQQVAQRIAEEILDWLGRNESALRSMAGPAQAVSAMVDGVARILAHHGAQQSDTMADLIQEHTGKRPKVCPHVRDGR